jgi:NADPH:quinone reductase
MRAAVINRPGGLDRLGIEDRPQPRPGPGEIAIEVAYAGCNWGDIQKRQGVYPDPVAYPACLGAEVSGFVSARGKGVSRVRLGQFVSAITGPDMLRGFADVVVAPDTYVIPLPPNFDPQLAAAFPLVSLTAYHLLHTAHRIRRGETVLVHAIGGAVGLMVTQLASAAGARVLGTVGSVPKAARPLEFGACRVVTRDSEDFVEAVMSETRGRGVDLVIDSIGGDVLERSFDAVRPFGRVISIGEASGEPEFAIRKKLYERSTSLSGFEVLHAQPGSRRWRRSIAAIVDALAAGTLNVPIAKVFPLGEIRKAQAYLEGRTAAGKVLLAVNS